MSEISFLENIRSGLEKADQALQNMEEIQGVFSNLSSDLIDATKGVICSEVKDETEAKIDNFLSAIAEITTPRRVRKYKALFLKNTTNNVTREIAEIAYHVDGYPIRITVNGNTTAYHDKDSLINGLGELVSSTQVGKAIKALLS